MRITANTSRELNEQLRQHAAVRRLQLPPPPTGKTPKIESASSLRRRIHQAVASDPRIGSLVTNARRVSQCREEGRALLRKSLAGEKATDRSARQFTKKWAGIEHDYQSVVGLSYELTSSNKALAAFAQAAKDIDDVHRFANPALLDRSQRLLLTEMGADIDDLMHAYRYAYLPDKKRLDQAIARVEGIPTDGRKQVGTLVFLYAPERLVERGVLTVAGGQDPVTIGLIIAAVSAAAQIYLDWLRFLEELRAAAASYNLLLFAVLWWIWFNLDMQLRQAQVQVAQLQQQYDDEVRLAQAQHETATVVETPVTVAQEFGYVIGNMSRSKLEVHLPNCSFARLISAEHARTFSTLLDAKAAGLDNCYYCIGGSTR
jgi:hypothetical protein